MKTTTPKRQRQDRSHANPPSTDYFTATLRNRSKKGLIMAMQEVMWSVQEGCIDGMLMSLFEHEAKAVGMSDEDLFEVAYRLMQKQQKDELPRTLPREMLPDLRQFSTADVPKENAALYPDLHSSLAAAWGDDE